MRNFLLLLALLPLCACNSKVYDLDALSKARPTALVFLSTECPISQKYISRINQLKVEYPQVQFIGVFPAWESQAALREFKTENYLIFKVISDREDRLLHQLGATHTPESFLLSPNKQILYHGAIDNLYYDLEQIHHEPTEQFLKMAIESYLSHRIIFLKDTRAVGCPVEQ